MSLEKVKKLKPWTSTVSGKILGLLGTKLMRLGSPNRIDDFESNLKSESERRIVVNSDSNDLIESTRSNTIYNRSIFNYIDIKLIKRSI